MAGTCRQLVSIDVTTLHPAALANRILPCIGLVQGTAYSGVLGQDYTDVGALLVTGMCHPDGQLLAGVGDVGREFRPTSGVCRASA
jgi:hypothetical protein